MVVRGIQFLLKTGGQDPTDPLKVSKKSLVEFSEIKDWSRDRVVFQLDLRRGIRLENGMCTRVVS